MKTWERWGLRIGFLTATFSGAAYGAFKYFGQVEGEFGTVPHFLQGPFQHAHILAAAIMVFALGLAVRGHASGMLHHHVRRGRRTGISLMIVGALMVVGGYAIQIVTGSGARAAAAWVHGSSSLLFVGLYVFHWFKPET